MHDSLHILIRASTFLGRLVGTASAYLQGDPTCRLVRRAFSELRLLGVSLTGRLDLLLAAQISRRACSLKALTTGRHRVRRGPLMALMPEAARNLGMACRVNVCLNYPHPAKMFISFYKGSRSCNMISIRTVDCILQHAISTSARKSSLRETFRSDPNWHCLYGSILQFARVPLLPARIQGSPPRHGG